MSREFLLVWDATMANPNGDMLNDNQPRCDKQTGKLEVSDSRVKRFVRDELISIGEKVFVQTISNEAGKVESCTTKVQKDLKANKINEKSINDVIKYLSTNYIDVRLFGVTITKPMCELTGPLQVTWSRSINKAEIKFMQGNSAYSSSDTKSQATIWSKYITPYALFRTYSVFNNNVASRQGVEVTEDDISKFKNALINGFIHYRSTSKNQMPRLLIEVVYKNTHVDGELDYIDTSFNCDDADLRSISDVSFDLTKLQDYVSENKDVYEVYVYKHRSVKNCIIPASFKVIDM